MNERNKKRSKEQNMTAFQANSRQSRNYLSGRLVSLIRSNNQNNEFSAQELLQIESLLRDEFQTNQWLLNVCKAVTDQSVLVSKEELEMFEKYKTEGKQVLISQSEVEELHKELKFLKERLSVLQNILKDLSQRFANFKNTYPTIDPNIGINTKKSNSVDIWLQMRTKLKESLEIIIKDLTNDFSVKDPKDIVDNIVTELNDKMATIVGTQNTNQWLNQMLDELALTEGNKKQFLDHFYHQFCLKLEDIHKNLNNLLKECVRIKNFYEVNVKEEMSWRSDLNALINHLQSLNGSEAIELNSMIIETNGLSAKKCLIEKYSQFFEKFEDQDFDELQALMEGLNRRIEMLSDKTKSPNVN